MGRQKLVCEKFPTHGSIVAHFIKKVKHFNVFYDFSKKLGPPEVKVGEI